MSDTIAELVEARVRERAYSLWEREGCPQGRAEEHWHRAAEAEAAALRTGQEAAQAQERTANGAAAAATPSRAGAAVRRRSPVRAGMASDAASAPAPALPEKADAESKSAAARPKAAAKRPKVNAAPRAPRRK
jgi:Protein of unknown function (DUF2934)